MEWLQAIFERLGELHLEDIQATDWLPLLAVLLVSCAAAMALSLLYALFFERRATGSDIHRAFPALGMAITGIFICLQYSLPLSLGLLGALSIVRFRTPIKEPEEIGFLMLLIASSICCATLNFVMLALLFGLTIAALAAMRWLPWFGRSRAAVASLVVTVEAGALAAILPQLQGLAREGNLCATLDAITDCGGTSSATLTLFRGDAAALADLQRRVRDLLPDGGEVSLFLQRPQPL